MKLTDFVIDFLSQNGMDLAFGLTGGAVVHIFDSIEKHPNFNTVFCHHEQAAAFAAAAYSKTKNKPCLCIVTTGPGGTNALTGLLGAWLDSIPCIFISGQSRIDHTSRGKPIRQLGGQEFDIVSVVESMTNYAHLLTDPYLIKYELEKALYMATSGRPGPVWLDIPLDFQWVDLELDKLKSFNPKEKFKNEEETAYLDLWMFKKFLSLSERPLILLGSGVHLGEAEELAADLINKWSIPFVSTWSASDILPTDHQLYLGRPGTAGQRGANLAIQNCDLLLALGSHLAIPHTGTNFDLFARDAKKVVVNIDQNELDFQTVRVDLPIRCDVKDFLKKIEEEKITYSNEISFWKEKCNEYKKYNSYSFKQLEGEDPVDPFYFLSNLSNKLKKDDMIVVDGGGTVAHTSFLAIEVKKGQRLISSTSIGAMGSGLSESIGVCLATDKKRTICLCGDGSLQLNIQELQTIVHNQLPIIIFVFNNQGYLSIRGTQEGFLDSNFAGSSKEGGLSLPDFMKIAESYGLKSYQIKNNSELEKNLSKVLSKKGPAFCELLLAENLDIDPRQGFRENPDGTFSQPLLEDMAPFLDIKVLEELMITKLYKD